MKFLKWLLAGWSLRGTEFGSLLIHEGFVVDKLSQEQIFCRNTSTRLSQNHSIYFVHLPLMLNNVVIEGLCNTTLLYLLLSLHPADILFFLIFTTVPHALS